MPSCRGHAVPSCHGHAPTLSPRRRGGSPRHSPSSRARSQQAAARGTFSTKTPSCRLRREQVNNLLFTQIRLPYVLKDGMQPVCFLIQDSHNKGELLSSHSRSRNATNPRTEENPKPATNRSDFHPDKMHTFTQDPRLQFLDSDSSHYEG